MTTGFNRSANRSTLQLDSRWECWPSTIATQKKYIDRVFPFKSIFFLWPFCTMSTYHPIMCALWTCPRTCQSWHRSPGFVIFGRQAVWKVSTDVWVIWEASTRNMYLGIGGFKRKSCCHRDKLDKLTMTNYGAEEYYMFPKVVSFQLPIPFSGVLEAGFLFGLCWDL